MKVVEGIARLDHDGYMVVTAGTFDGVHVGHKAILQQVCEQASIHNGKSVVITFWPHPKFILGDASTLKLLSTWKEKEELFRKSGIDFLVKIPFTKEFSELTGDAFIRQVLVDAIGTKKLIIGYDHKFGKNREGSFEYLQENASQYGFEVEEIPRQDIDHIGISSTKVRKALMEGNIEHANEFLGYHYMLEGKVVEGDNIGTGLGFPTANLHIEESFKLIPADGIYAVTVDFKGKSFDGMLYIGNRPTLQASPKTIEVNIFNFDQSIYGERIRVNFVALLRKDQRFDSLEMLKQQLIVDKEQAISVLKQLK
ncbi:MAG: bifunctional riboflavin kinase/FAD synthetase [Imperialibacter sp.]|uniref:bifunctional riboflavin kinase/FAD synthetase n=1 Tax=Imperialibacter sp. TaxID=2038411 RepID=UPI0032ED02A7